MPGEQTTPLPPTFIEAFMTLEENIGRRKKLPSVTLEALTEIIETGRDTLVTGEPSETAWEEVVGRMARIVHNIPNLELVGVIGGIVQASGVKLPEQIAS